MTQATLAATRASQMPRPVQVSIRFWMYSRLTIGTLLSLENELITLVVKKEFRFFNPAPVADPA
jgi:hypothetical protein